jgi:hypothetical protein
MFQTQLDRGSNERSRGREKTYFIMEMIVWMTAQVAEQVLQIHLSRSNSNEVQTMR